VVEDRKAASVIHQIALLGTVEQEPIAIVAPAATLFGSTQDIIEQTSQHPGAVPIGTPPPGSAPHLAALRLQALAETTLHIVTFPSTAAACQAAVSGKVTAAVLGLSSVIADLRRGRLAGLGIAAANSADAFPDMPPLLDSGIDLSAAIRRGLAAPSGLPDHVVATLARAMEDVAEDPEFLGQADSYGFVAAWMDGRLWTAEANSEQVELAKLWQSGPWLPPAQG
jgi:tripartite-type tricarboxylate transporter receptor subunit TctC